MNIFSLLKKWAVSFLIGSFLFSLVIYKAAATSFTHDEALSLFHYIKFPFSYIITYGEVSANNHMLNSIFAKITSSIFGNSETALRLPNIIAFAILIISFAKWIHQKSKNLIVIISGFAILFLNNQSFEFYSLSRGYGLSFLFLFLSINSFLESTKPSSNSSSNKMFIWMILMVLSSFSTLYIFAGLCLIYLTTKIRKGIPIKQALKKPLFYGLGLVLIIGKPIYKLIQSNQLYFGGTSNFYSDSLATLIQGLFVNTEFFENLTLIIYVTLGFFGLIAITVSSIFKGAWLKHSSLLFFLILITFGINIISHWVFNTKFLIHRTALPYYLLLSVFLIHFLLDLSEIKYIRFSSFVIGIGISVGLSYTFYTTFSPSYFRDWKYDQDSKVIMQDLSSLGAQKNKPIIIGCDFLRYPVLKYYETTSSLSNIHEVYKDSIPKKCNVIITGIRIPIKPLENMRFVKKFPISNSKIFISSELYD